MTSPSPDPPDLPENQTVGVPMATLADVDLAGRRLGDFELLRRLGRGAMAEVYLAEQASLRRQVAIKILKGHLSADETFVKRFHHEAQAAASLVHANIVQIYEVGFQEGWHYIAQEYVQGQNLRELINRQGPLDVRLAVAVLRQVALALDKAAGRGIVHRDIKPENIMISRSGEVKVADFGLARLSGTSELNLTQIGMTMGTPLYMSPEQVEGRPLDSRSDIYSLGVTCFHMLTGAPPFKGETALSVAVQHLNAQPPRLEQQRPDLPPGLCRIVHKMLAKDLAQRYATPRELLADLRALDLPGLDHDWWQQIELSGGFDLEARSLDHSATQQLAAAMQTEALAVIRRRRHRVLLALGLLTALLLGGLLNWLTREPFLLAGAHETPIPKQDSARAQFFFAQLQPTDREAWLKSVREYFPRDEFFVHRAQQELALYYLQQNRLEEALTQFQELAGLSQSQQEFRACGLAGQSIVYTMQGHQDKASLALAQLGPLRQKLEPRMSRLMVYPLGVNRRAMDAQTAHDWDEWKKKLPPEEPPDASDSSAS
jgi:eukaryotic-like serine/threonine-protein kinase